MKATNGQKIRTGIFTIAGLFLLVGAVFLIGRTKNMFGDTFHIYGTFRNVGGLQVGNNVRFVGVNVGTVESIRIISDTLARVDMILEAKVHPYIKKDAVASIGSDGLMGDKLIAISATSESAGTLIANGDKITTEDPTDMGKTMATVQHIAENAAVITENLAGITGDINEGRGSLGKLLHSDNLANNLEGTVKELKNGTKGFSDNMQALKGNFLLRGYYRRKERKQQEAAEKAQQQPQDQPAPDDNKKKKK